RSATPTSSATSLATISRAHHEPIPPAPTTTTFAGRSPGRRGKPVGRGLGLVSRVASDDTRDLGAAVPVAGGVGDLHRCRLAVLGTGPDRGVGEHALDLRLVVDGVLLVAGAEVEHLALAATEHGAGAEHLAAGEGGDEYELVRCGDVEHLPVHLLLGDDDRVGHAASDRVGAVDGPDPLLLALVAPQQVAGGAHEGLEGLGVVGGVKRQEAHALVDAADHALAGLVRHVLVGHVAPPGQDVGRGGRRLGEGLAADVEPGDAHLGVD